MEAIRSSETSIRTRTTRRHTREDGILQYVRRVCVNLATSFSLLAWLFATGPVATTADHVQRIVSECLCGTIHSMTARGEFNMSACDGSVLTCRLYGRAGHLRHSPQFKDSLSMGNLFTLLYFSERNVLIALCAMWSSSRSFWLLTHRSRVRFPALTDFLSSTGCGTGSTQPL
jgi:hypothetical protein